MLVHNASGSKLNVHAREARWLGLDVDMKAHRVFWPGMGNVTVERNVYFGASASLEGEEDDLSGKSSEQNADPPTPTSSTPIDQPDLGDQPDRSDPISPSPIDEDGNKDDEPERPKSPAPLLSHPEAIAHRPGLAVRGRCHLRAKYTSTDRPTSID